MIPAVPVAGRAAPLLYYHRCVTLSMCHYLNSKLSPEGQFLIS